MLTYMAILCPRGRFGSRDSWRGQEVTPYQLAVLVVWVPALTVSDPHAGDED